MHHLPGEDGVCPTSRTFGINIQRYRCFNIGLTWLLHFESILPKGAHSAPPRMSFPWNMTLGSSYSGGSSIKSCLSQVSHSSWVGLKSGQQDTKPFKSLWIVNTVSRLLPLAVLVCPNTVAFVFHWPQHHAVSSAYDSVRHDQIAEVKLFDAQSKARSFPLLW
jgi:hypothetical protein